MEPSRGALQWSSNAQSAASATEPSREALLLIQCVRGTPSKDDGAGLRQVLEASVDWEEVRIQAAWHGVSALLEDPLARYAEDLVPRPVLEALQRYRRASAVRNLFLFSRLVDLLEQFEARGIPAIPFKGSILAHTAYEDASLREFSDLDVLVPRAGLPQASELLETLGFEARQAPADGRRPRAADWTRYARAYDRATDGVTVDLHWHLVLATFRAGIRIARLWEETRIYEIGGTPLRSFTPEATLLVLCIHGAKHGPTPWPRLKWVVDVDRVIRTHRDLDWTALGRLAEELGCGRILSTGVSLAGEVLGTPVSPTLLSETRRDHAARDILERSRASLQRGPSQSADRARDIEYRLALRERWRDKLSTFVRGAVFPQSDDLRLVRLPEWLGFLYSPIRVGRLAAKFLFGRSVTLTGRSARRTGELATHRGQPPRDAAPAETEPGQAEREPADS